MQTLNKILSLTLVFTLLILTSCQKEDFNEATNFDDLNVEIDTRVPMNFYSSMSMMCTITRDCQNPDPFGGCFVLFPPQPSLPDFSTEKARGTAFVNEDNQLSFYLYSDLSIPGDAKNTIQDFVISNMVVPADAAEKLYGPSSPGEITLIEGNYMAEVKDNFLSLSVPSNAGNVNVVIWYNESINSEESAGFYHNKFISELHNENGEFYKSLSSTEQIFAEVQDDCEELCSLYDLGACDIPDPTITGQSSHEMIEMIDGLNAYEKDFLSTYVSAMEGINPFSNDGIGEVLYVTNSYESSVVSDENIENKQALLTFLSTSKFSALYWSSQEPIFDGDDLPQRMSKFWWTVTCDAIGSVKGFLFFGPLGSPITGVLYSVIGNLTYDYFFD